MLGRTHEVAAICTVASAAILYPINNMTLETAIISFLVAVIGGVTPDIDKPGTKLWKDIPTGSTLSRVIHPVFIGGHRHITHSLLGLFLFGLGARALLDMLPPGDNVNTSIVFLSFIIAFASHLVADMFTKEGVPLLFPLPFHIGFPPFEFLRIQTNGLAENLVVTPGIIALVIYLGYSHPENVHIILKTIGFTI